MCHPSRHHAMHSLCGCGPHFRRFMTGEEERKMLEEYREELEKELTGVQERIQELKKK